LGVVGGPDTPELKLGGLKPVFNRTVTLRDTWANITKAGRENE
jgi:hypothetical protein